MLPGLGYLALAATILTTVPLQAARHFYPDVGWGLTVTALVAAGWALVRTVVAVATLRRRPPVTPPTGADRVPQEVGA